mmetsp:Transcript_9908/g.27646  ORF Transcript_9908/g.27646 Transcript_9908/m.27646 type:complete len:219 (+) Transcript_9908:859-1515(+)
MSPQRGLTAFMGERPEFHCRVVASTQQPVLVRIEPHTPHRSRVTVERPKPLRTPHVPVTELTMVLCKTRCSNARFRASGEPPHEERTVIRGGNRSTLARGGTTVQLYARHRASVGLLAHQGAHCRQSLAPPRVGPPSAQESESPRVVRFLPGHVMPLPSVGLLPQSIAARPVQCISPRSAGGSQRDEITNEHATEDLVPDLLRQRLTWLVHDCPHHWS